MSELVRIKQIEGLATELAAKALDAQVVKIANNLSDVNAGTARNNLSIYSKSEVDALVTGAKNAFNVADITTRNALTGLKVTDRVFVNDDGDGKWALYIVTAVTDGKGSTSTYKKIADEDLFTNALTAAAVKAAYESNADTYAFNGTYKGKLDKITVTGNVNLDTIKSTADTALANAATAQTTANSASTSASNAQNTANAANSAAAAAQGTANSALSQANSAFDLANTKQSAFTQTTESFIGVHGNANSPINVTLSHVPKNGMELMVFFNGVRVKNVSYRDNLVTFQVPYITEDNDDIMVTYSY